MNLCEATKVKLRHAAILALILAVVAVLVLYGIAAWLLEMIW